MKNTIEGKLILVHLMNMRLEWSRNKKWSIELSTPITEVVSRILNSCPWTFGLSGVCDTQYTAKKKKYMCKCLFFKSEKTIVSSDAQEGPKNKQCWTLNNMPCQVNRKSYVICIEIYFPSTTYRHIYFLLSLPLFHFSYRPFFQLIYSLCR